MFRFISFFFYVYICFGFWLEIKFYFLVLNFTSSSKLIEYVRIYTFQCKYEITPIWIEYFGMRNVYCSVASFILIGLCAINYLPQVIRYQLLAHLTTSTTSTIGFPRVNRCERMTRGGRCGGGKLEGEKASTDTNIV